MSDKNPNTNSGGRHYQGHPYKMLGRHLKTMRQKLQESLGETSGAVEIQVEQLDRFERGVEAPSEDILLLLISHFGIQEDEAVELWELAGYERTNRFENDERQDVADGQYRQPIPVMLLAVDNRVLYTNGVDIEADQSGMVLHFTQNGKNEDADNAKTTVSKIGMSHDQAEQLIASLQRALLHKKYLSGPKQLPPSAS